MSKPYHSKFVATVGWLEGRLVESMYAHGAAALKDFGDLCRKRAGEAYANDDEQRAKILREIANELDGTSAAMRRQQAYATLETGKWDEPIDYDEKA